MIRVSGMKFSPGAPLAIATVRLQRRPDTVTVFTDAAGIARAVPHAVGPQQIRIRAMGYRYALDTVTIRAGYVDTITVLLRVAPICLGPISVDRPPTKRSDM